METYTRERRRYKRINLQYLSLPIELKINNIKDIIVGTIVNISINGIKILTPKRISEDSIVSFKLKLDKIKTNNILSKVIWLKENKGIYYVGLQFANISPKDFFNLYNYIKNCTLINKELN